MRHVGGQMQQGSMAGATALYENGGPAVSGGDAGDAVMARWLQSAGLQHLASPVASNAVDHRMLPNLLMQGYGPQSAEEKQRLFKLMRNLNFNGETVSEPYTPSAQSSGAFASSEGFYSPEFKGDFGAGLLDLHSMDDTELLSDHVITEPFEPSPFLPAVTKAFESDCEIASRQQRGQTDTTEAIAGSAATEKESSTRENNLAKIKVVVRKRPLNKKEISRKEDDIVTAYDDAYLTVHEPKLKVDLTAYVEKHEFCFDAVLDEHVTNGEVYANTVEPIIPTIFQRTKATCFAYGQTDKAAILTPEIDSGSVLLHFIETKPCEFFPQRSGKTYTMQPLPLRAAEDLEFEVSDVHIVKEYIERGNAARSTGSTGANEESSRSHAILQLAVKKHLEVKESKRSNNINDANEPRSGKIVGKISFIDLAGSERGADTTDNDRQTRIEGAEINKSLLALKECIRALDNDQIHIPFRGSKLTEVLRDSFVGNSRTVMISCISPNAGSCEHTLNTLRYADRVKSLSKSGNPRKDQTNSLPPVVKEPSSLAPTLSLTSESEEAYEQLQVSKVVDTSRRHAAKEVSSFNDEKLPSSFSSNVRFSGREESEVTAGDEKERSLEVRNAFRAPRSQKTFSVGSYSQSSTDVEERVQKVSPPRQKAYSYKDEKIEEGKRDIDSLDLMPPSSYKQRIVYNSSARSTGSKQCEPEPPPDGRMNEILEEEEALIAAHRKEIEDTMEIVRESGQPSSPTGKIPAPAKRAGNSESKEVTPLRRNLHCTSFEGYKCPFLLCTMCNCQSRHTKRKVGVVILKHREVKV
ncbi:kinesin motor family protein [Striga asiatica]|uniref:Kinesin-like protein n=1 Tax=Striga asiatica TaxID=4170 RepID=A0A5A7R446_STRAF|nr:kinesin motor family protein [Striga asiatica]